jgi:toxin-antitoxin system PIN domain toxin
MMLPDVNVLISAFRTDLPRHSVCRQWLVDIISGDARFAVSTMVLSAVVRITTNGRIFKSPTSIGEAFEFCQSLLTQPHCQPVEPGERHWDIFRNLCVRSEVRGPRVTDAWFAALAIESGSQWITLDRDFARFPGLDWRVPEI